MTSKMHTTGGHIVAMVRSQLAMHCSNLFLILTLYSFDSLLASSVHPTCPPPITFTYVHDVTGQPLCSADIATTSAPSGGSRGDCLRYCAYKLPGCVIYSYHENSTRCDVYDFVSRNFVVKSGCVSYPVSGTRSDFRLDLISVDICV